MAKIFNKKYRLCDVTKTKTGYTPANAKLEIRLKITQYPEENRSVVDSYLYLIVTNFDEEGRVGFASGRVEAQEYTNGGAYGDFGVAGHIVNNTKFNVMLEYGETLEYKLGEYLGYEIYHNIDGNANIHYTHTWERLWFHAQDTPLNFPSETRSYTVALPTIDRALYPTTATNFTDEENPSFTYTIANSTHYHKYDYYKISNDSHMGTNSRVFPDEITSAQLALSLDGETVDIAYRDIPLDGTSYTFDLTEEEREILRVKAQGSPTVPIYYLTKITRTIINDYSSRYYYIELHEPTSFEFIGKTQRNFTVVGCNPSLAPEVWDIKEETLALTGDENTVIRYESMVEYAVNATASKHAEIVSQSVTCGSKTVEGLPYGIIDDVESGLFLFKAIDSRNLVAEMAVQKNLIEYVKPTCYQNLKIELSGETGANILLTTSGSYYNGSFGAVDNTLLLEVRYKEEDGAEGEWITLTGAPTFNGTTYELESLLEGFDYSKTYIFQCRATDKLNYVISSQYKITLKPIFDWSKEDYNFNVPINMHGKTVLRHNETANNTVLSASGGHVYIRPGGTDNTEGEIMIKPDGITHFTTDVEIGNNLVLTDDDGDGGVIAGTGKEIYIKPNINDETAPQTIISPNGDIEVNGAVNFEGNIEVNGTTNFNNSVTFTSDTVLNPYVDFSMFGDYVVATGTESMGSNGVWYWQKWKSGKVECWGKRNFGKMSISTKHLEDSYDEYVTGFYKTADYYEQTFPSGLFADTPDFVDMFPINFGKAYGSQIWIVPWYDSITSTAVGTTKARQYFSVLSLSSGTKEQSYIGFHVIGRAKMYAINEAWEYYHEETCSSMLATGLGYDLVTEEEAIALGYKKHTCKS